MFIHIYIGNRDSPISAKVMNIIRSYDITTYNSLKLSILALSIILLLLVIQLSPCECKWALEIPDGLDAADEVASQIGCRNLGLVKGSHDIYLFERLHQANQANDNDENPRILNFRSSHMKNLKRSLEEHPKVNWVEPQVPLKRTKRDLFSRLGLQSIKSSSALGVLNQQQQQSGVIPIGLPESQLMGSFRSFNDHMRPQQIINKLGPNGKLLDPMNLDDELWISQWYLRDDDEDPSTLSANPNEEIRLNVEAVWRMGYTGKGVVVTVLDDGLEWNHTDLYSNYDPRASWDMNFNRSDPFPRYDYKDTNNHGTRCAGEIAMVANNRKCGVGIAPNARIGGIKILDSKAPREDNVEYSALLHNIDHIDIYTNSWGPNDDGREMDGPKRLASQALDIGSRFGRHGKGAIYIWANGNGGYHGDNCAADGYITSIFSISVGAVTQHGQFPSYGESCSSTLAVAPSSGVAYEKRIVTTDLHNMCITDFTGTSASAPLAAGIFALVLEANPDLTWRDAQHLLAWTANPIPLRKNSGWRQNAAGFLFNNQFGFGLMNAETMVRAAINWKTVPTKSECIVTPSSGIPIYFHSGSIVRVTFQTDGCQREYELKQQQKLKASPQLQYNQQYNQHFIQHYYQPQHQGLQRPSIASVRYQQQQQQQHYMPVIFLEHVQLIVDIAYSNRGSIDIFLISPSGTVSTMLSRRPNDKSPQGFVKWPLMSVHFWAEKSMGQWTMIVRDKESRNNRGMLRNATLKLHGTSMLPLHMVEQKRPYEASKSLLQDIIDTSSELDPHEKDITLSSPSFDDDILL